MPDTAKGSSPRVWGTLAALSALNAVTGLIPTGVGNTIRQEASIPALRAHPHGCGEHLRRNR